MENNDGFEVIRSIPAPSLPYGKPGTTYTLVHLPDDPTHGELTWLILTQTRVHHVDVSVIVLAGLTDFSKAWKICCSTSTLCHIFFSETHCMNAPYLTQVKGC